MSPDTLPELLDRLRGGDESAVGDLTPALYSELRRIASRHLRGERPNHTLQPTALVHEAYLKLSGSPERAYNGEPHFLAVASRVMRQVLVDHARSRNARKRKGRSGAAPNDDNLAACATSDQDRFARIPQKRQNEWSANLELGGENEVELVDLIELDSAIEALAADNQKLARLVEMRYFGGMTAEESAEALGISAHIVRHDLRFAHAWLRRRLSGK
ncbi:MAG: sigma-70 family RNA polymerase sigma factor [Bryobacteraceae bacterium]